jgi:lipase chaperone LimK
MPRRTLAGAAAVLAAAAWWAWAGGSPPTAAPRSRPISRAGGVPAAHEATRREAIAAALRRPPAIDPRSRQPPDSLQDTAIDGALAVDGDGRLLVTPEVRRFFDYFFVATGEEDDDRIRARIEAEIRARLHGPARDAALALLDRYLDYRERGRALAATATLGAEPTARVEALRRLRRESFGEQDAAALFADEEAALAVAAEQRRIAADPGLSDDERAARLAALEAQLPQAVREARAAVTAPLRLARDEAALREIGGSAEEIRALREQVVGRAAADRLAALDQRRAEWQARVDTYRQERAAIDADPSLAAEQRETALEALRASHFRDPELPRIRALDRIEAATP